MATVTTIETGAETEAEIFGELTPEVCLEDTESIFQRPTELSMHPVIVGVINRLGQQRPDRNERQADLDASVADRAKHDAKGGGLINPVNVGLVEPGLFKDYVEFTNRTWGADRSVDEFRALADGKYAVLIAGHSRYESRVRAIEAGGESIWVETIEAQIHKVQSIEDILDIQLHENIHSSPPPDRAARAYAESFLWAKARDPGLTKAEFVRRKNGLTAGALSDALLYVELPPKVRALTDNGGLPFTVAIELGRALPWVRADAADLAESQTDDPEEQLHRSEELTSWELLRFIVKFNSEGRHITNTRAAIRAHAKSLKDKHEGRAAKDLELTIFDARDYNSRLEFVKKEVTKTLNEYDSNRFDEARTLHSMVLELVSGGALHEQLVAVEDEIRELGGLALVAVRSPDEQPQGALL